MAASPDESKVVTPFMPSLAHFASVRIAISLFEEFGVETLVGAFTEIQKGDLTTSEENGSKRQNAKKILLYIPSHLRRNVMEAVHGSHQAVLGWACHHDKFKDETCSLHWRSDGSIHASKTAQNLVMNAKFCIRDRLLLAAAYLLKESILALEAEMPEFDEISPPLYAHSRQTLSRIFETSSALIPRCSILFPLLQPDERRICFIFLDIASFDDLRFSLYDMTKNEEEHILQKGGAYRLLSLHLMWPLQTLFLDTAAKLWNYIDTNCFNALLSDIFYFNDKWGYLNYTEIFEKFWNKSPAHLKESVIELPELRQRIDSYFEIKSRKRKFDENDQSQNI